MKARPSKKYWTKYNKHVIPVQSDRSVSMTVRFHLFPFRTQKLSSLVPKIVRWKRRVKIGSRRLKKRFRRNSEAFFFCRKALSNLFLRVYTGMLVSKNIRVPAASRFLRLPPHHVFWQKSPYSLPLHLVHLRPPASQFQRRTQHCCHCIDNNTENLPPMHSQLFSTPADQQHSPAWKRQPFRIRRHRQLHLSGKNWLHSEAQRHPCIQPQLPQDMPPEWPVHLHSVLCFRPEYKIPRFAQLPLSVQSLLHFLSALNC